MNRQSSHYTTEKDQQSTKEGEAFWQDHIAQYQKTKLNRRAYCREQNLSYNKFQYWFYKLRASSTAKPKAIPVMLKQDSINYNLPALCTLELGLGKRLLIHDRSIVNYLLES
jgi:hypothetical protein